MIYSKFYSLNMRALQNIYTNSVFLNDAKSLNDVTEFFFGINLTEKQYEKGKSGLNKSLNAYRKELEEKAETDNFIKLVDESDEGKI